MHIQKYFYKWQMIYLQKDIFLQIIAHKFQWQLTSHKWAILCWWIAELIHKTQNTCGSWFMHLQIVVGHISLHTKWCVCMSISVCLSTELGHIMWISREMMSFKCHIVFALGNSHFSYSAVLWPWPTFQQHIVQRLATMPVFCDRPLYTLWLQVKKSQQDFHL